MSKFLKSDPLGGEMGAGGADLRAHQCLHDGAWDQCVLMLHDAAMPSAGGGKGGI